MVHTPRASTACEVVPAPGEPPCAQRGYGFNPRLCNVHRKQYVKLTMAYKDTSLEVERLYADICGNNWKEAALWNADDVQAALETVRTCLRAMERELGQRREHHRRFFPDLDEGHERWIQYLLQRQQEVGLLEVALGRYRDELTGTADIQVANQQNHKRSATSPLRLDKAWVEQRAHSRSASAGSVSSRPSSPPRPTRPPSPRRACLASLEAAPCGSRSGRALAPCPSEALLTSDFCAAHVEEYHFFAQLHASAMADYDALAPALRCAQRAAAAGPRAYASARELARDVALVEECIDVLADVGRYEEQLCRLQDGLASRDGQDMLPDPLFEEAMARAVLQTLKRLQCSFETLARARGKPWHGQLAGPRQVSAVPSIGVALEDEWTLVTMASARFFFVETSVTDELWAWCRNICRG
ncbi:hypothetical protein BD413DRAFT_615464 [Trametes elegans]|nr:hypothetical protein BD413DRAFT_615464 [Trametes elegans]